MQIATWDILIRYKGIFHCEGCQSLLLLREAVEPSTLRIFNSQVYVALSNLIKSGPPLSRGLDHTTSRVPSSF